MLTSCIITDNAAQFSKVNFPENISLRFIDYETEYSFPSSKQSKTQKGLDFPRFLKLDQSSIIRNPSSANLHKMLEQCANNYDDVFIILHSRQFNPVFDLVSALLKTIHGRASIHLIDSQSISIGQGYLIQSALDMMTNNYDGYFVEEKLREKIPHIYTLFCSPSHSYLHNSKFIDIGQSVVSEMLSLLPVFSLEDGKFTPVDKIKNIHGVIEHFIEYIDEFEEIEQVAFLQSTPSSIQEARLIKLYLEENYPETLYTEHPHNNYLASLIGPRGFGLVVIERT